MLAALALRVARLLQTPNLYSSDPATRALFAEKLTMFGWAEVYQATIWPPAHFWLLSWGQWFGSANPQVGARSVAVVLGTLACWPAFLVARRSALILWPGAHGLAVRTGALAATLLALEPLGLRFATLTYAEVPCTFFVLAACASCCPTNEADRHVGGLRWAAWPLPRGCATRPGCWRR